MKKTKTLFDQAIEIIEEGGDVNKFIKANTRKKQYKFYDITTLARSITEVTYDCETSILSLYTRLLLARELWNDGQEKYWKAGLFK